MALYMEEERDRLICPACYGRTFFERNIYAYIKTSTGLQATLDKTVIICERCEEQAHEIKAGKGTIKR